MDGNCLGMTSIAGSEIVLLVSRLERVARSVKL